MPNTHETLGELFTDIADSIRGKTGSSAAIVADNFPDEIDAISTGTDTSDATATASDLLSDKTAYGADGKITGTIPSKAATTYNVSTSDQTITAGQYLAGAQTIKGVTTSNIDAGNIKYNTTVKVGDASNSGSIKNVTGTFTGTVSTGQSKAAAGQILSGYSGYVDGAEVKGSIGSKSAATYNTSTSDQTITAGQYLSGAQTIKAVTTSNIDAGNIKYNVNVKVGDANSSGRIKNVTGTFTSTVSSGQTKAAAAQILSGYSAYVDGAEVKGSIATKTSSNLTANGATVTVPAGYYASAASKAVATTTHPKPTVSINTSTGVVTASHTSTAGYISSANTATGTLNLTTQAAATITPGTSNKTAVAAGRYTTGAVTVAGNSNLVAGNIKKGTSIFGVTGTFGGSTAISGTYTYSQGLQKKRIGIGSDKYYTNLYQPTGKNGNYALFVDGISSAKNTYAISNTLTRTQFSGISLNNLKGVSQGVNVGNYCLFAGQRSKYSTVNNLVTYYNQSLTKGTTTLSIDKGECLVSSIGNYALIAGGLGYDSDYEDIDYYKQVETFNTSLTRSTATNLDECLVYDDQSAYYGYGGKIANSYGIFIGSTRKSNAYNASLTKTSLAAGFGETRSRAAIFSVGNYCICGGGTVGSTYKNTAIAYNTSLTKTNATNLTVSRAYAAGESNGSYGLFAGGKISSSTYLDSTEVYDASLVHTVGPELSDKTSYPKAALAGSYIICGGHGSYFLEDYYLDAFSQQYLLTLTCSTSPTTKTSGSITGYLTFT